MAAAAEGGVTGFHNADAWVDPNFASRADPRQNDKSGNTQVAPKGATPMFPTFPVFLVPRIDPLLVLDVLTVFSQRGTKNTDYTCLSPCYGLVTQSNSISHNKMSLKTKKKKIYCQLIMVTMMVLKSCI